MRTAILLLAVVPAAARANLATWFWTVSDTGNGDGVIEPGESALLTLSVAFDPVATGLALAGPYTISGEAAWSRGTVDDRANLFDPHDFFDDGSLDELTNAISDIEHFQFPPVAGEHFYPDNPIDVFAIRWTPADYRPATVVLNNGAPDAWIYLDNFGQWALYDGAGGNGAFDVVPASPTTIVVAFGIALATRRRG